MSEAQPPPRIRIGLPFTRKSRCPFAVSSEVNSLMPNRTSARSDSLPLTSTAIDSEYCCCSPIRYGHHNRGRCTYGREAAVLAVDRQSEEHTSELQSQSNIVCRLLL